MVATPPLGAGRRVTRVPARVRVVVGIFLVAVVAATANGSDWDFGWSVALTSTLALPGACIAVKELLRPGAALLQLALTAVSFAAFLPLWLWCFYALFFTYPDSESSGPAVNEDRGFGLLLAGLVVPPLLYFVLRRTSRSPVPRLLAGGVYCVVLIGYLLDQPF